MIAAATTPGPDPRFWVYAIGVGLVVMTIAYAVFGSKAYALGWFLAAALGAVSAGAGAFYSVAHGKNYVPVIAIFGGIAVVSYSSGRAEWNRPRRRKARR